MLFCSLAVFDPRVGHTMDVLSPFISVLYHSDWLFHGKSCPCLDVVHPGRAWPSSPACTWHCFLHSLSPGNSLVSSWCDHSMLASLLWRCLTVPFLLHCIADIVKSVQVWCWHTRYVIVSTRQSHCSPWSAGIQLSADCELADCCMRWTHKSVPSNAILIGSAILQGSSVCSTQWQTHIPRNVQHA